MSADLRMLAVFASSTLSPGPSVALPVALLDSRSRRTRKADEAEADRPIILLAWYRQIPAVSDLDNPVEEGEDWPSGDAEA